MKTARRHELRENELAMHIESLGDTLRRHGPKLAVVAAAAIAVILGARFYRGYQQSVREDAWKVIGQNPLTASKDLSVAATQLQELADRGVSPEITRAALQRVLTVGIAGMMQAGLDGKPEDASRLAERVKAAAGQLKDRFSDHPESLACAEFAEGYLAEQRGDYDAARKIYESVKANPKFASQPYPDQAEYRLSHLDRWKTPVVFAPPLPPASAPASGPASAVRLGGFDPAGAPMDATGAANTLIEPTKTVPATQPAGAP